jgi:FemAB-related protein (PEP-CTERM system-associated)
VIISRLSPSDIEGTQRWNAFVQGCPEATFFHRAEWQTIIRDVFHHPTYFLLAENNGEIEGILPLAHVKSLLFGNALTALPFAVYGGVAASTPETVAALEDEAQKLAIQLGVDHLEFRNQNARHPEWPTQNLYVTFTRCIPDILDEKMFCIPQKRRNMVRKAIKLGLYATHGDSVDEFFPVYAENVRDHGTPALPKAYFSKLMAAFGDDCEILTVRNAEGKPVSASLSFYFRDRVLAYYAGERAIARSTAANDLKYWSLMQRAASRGARIFDLGRSKKGTGSFEFKRLWEFEAEQLNYEYVLIKANGIPQNNPMNPKYRLFIALWQRFPIPLANLLGPMIVRNLG